MIDLEGWESWQQKFQLVEENMTIFSWEMQIECGTESKSCCTGLQGRGEDLGLLVMQLIAGGSW